MASKTVGKYRLLGELGRGGMSVVYSGLQTSLNRTVAMGASVIPGFPGNPDGASGQVWVDVNRSTGPARGHAYILCTAGPFGANPSNVLFARSTDSADCMIRENTGAEISPP